MCEAQPRPPARCKLNLPGSLIRAVSSRRSVENNGCFSRLLFRFYPRSCWFSWPFLNEENLGGWVVGKNNSSIPSQQSERVCTRAIGRSRCRAMYNWETNKEQTATQPESTTVPEAQITREESPSSKIHPSKPKQSYKWDMQRYGRVLMRIDPPFYL